MRLQRNYVCAVWLCEWSRGVSHPPAYWKPISTWSHSAQTSHTFPFSFYDMQAFLYFYFHCFLASYSLEAFSFTLPSFWWVCSISKPLISFHTAPVKTGTDHRGFIFAPGRSGFILPSPAQRKTALLSPVLGCQPLIIEFPMDPQPSARL